MLKSVLSDGCFWRIKLATSLLQLLYCHDPHRTVGILLCVFALAMTVIFWMLSTQPDFLRHGLAFPSPPRKTASSSFTDGQSVHPLLVLLTFGGSIHGSFYLNQPEALYATPTTRMILFVLCHLMSSFLYPKELCSTRAISPADSSVSGWYLMPTTTQLSGGISCNCQYSTNLW